MALPTLYKVLYFPYSVASLKKVFAPRLVITYWASHGVIHVSKLPVSDATNPLGEATTILAEPGQAVYLDREPNPAGDVYFPTGSSGHLLLSPKDLFDDASAESSPRRWLVTLTFHNNSPENGKRQVNILPSYRGWQEGDTFQLDPPQADLQTQFEALNKDFGEEKDLPIHESFTYCILIRPKLVT